MDFAKLREECAGLHSHGEILARIAHFVQSSLHADSAVISLINPSGEVQHFCNGVAGELRKPMLEFSDGGLRCQSDPVNLSLFIHDIEKVRGAHSLIPHLEQLSIRSFAGVPIRHAGGLHGWIECLFVERYFRWQPEDQVFLEQIADFAAMRLESLGAASENSTELSPIERRVLQESSWGYLACNSAGVILDVNEKLRELTGFKQDGIIEGSVYDFIDTILDKPNESELRQSIEAACSGKVVSAKVSGRVKSGKGRRESSLSFQIESGVPNQDRVVLLVKGAPVVSTVREELHEVKRQFRRLAEYGDLIIIRADSSFLITDIIGDTESLLGMTRQDLLVHQDVWSQFVHPEDLRKLGRRIRRMGDQPSELSEEIRIVHRITKRTHWLMLKAVPYFGGDHEFQGWEGFGVDISERRDTQEELERQSSRIEALYEVSRALEVNLDPAVVVLKGLRALVKATDSDSGFGCFYDPETGTLEIAAAEGLSQRYLEAVSKIVGGRSLVRHAVESKKGLLINNIQKDDRAAVDVAKIEDLKSTIVMPLLFEERVLGAIVLFCRHAKRYTTEDFDLVSAAASQIGLAARQAEYYAAEKRHAGSLKILYRLSHEISKLLTPQEVAEHAFPIVQQELSCKRMWLGVVNEQGTHIVGQGGIGPGIRRHIRELQIEIGLRHDFLDEALRSRQPILVDEGTEMQCSGLNRLVRRLRLGNFVIIPLVSLGQIVGVFIIEPSVSSKQLVQRKLPLLSSMASEIATVILARRFESKMADADKMRMAGLLASGVAHNFNNLLQAVMGQASLIEMQVSEGSPLASSAKTIVDAATRGAGLIKQLLSFSMQEGFDKRPLSISSLLKDSEELYRSLLGSNITLELWLEDDIPEIIGDYSQVQQIITNLLMNAKEAIEPGKEGFVRIQTRASRLRSGEVDPEIAPGEYVRIDVQDSGVGMDTERQARCFEPFFTTKDVDRNTGIGLSGSGLGLSSAYSITRHHGGVLTVSSNPGEGSVFSVFFPVALSQEVVSEAGAVRTITSAPVLIVDLESSVAFSVRSTLESLGLPAKIIADGENLLEVLSDSKDEVKLVIIDADRFGDELSEFVEKIVSQHRQIAVIISSVDRERWSTTLLHLDRVSVVEKPIGVWAIHSVVRKLLPLGREVTLAPEPLSQKESVVEERNGSGERLEGPPQSSKKAEVPE